MIVRELLTLIGFKVDGQAEKKAKSSFQRIKDAAGGLGFALSAGAVAIGFKKLIDAASDVDETMNVVTTLFQDQTQAVLDWAKVAGEASGRSEYSMREYAAQIAQVSAATLDSTEATADLSTTLAQATVDLASFNNETEADTLAAIRAGLLGSSEPLQRFGVDLRVAALDAFALEQGLGKTTKQMNAAEKMTLAYRKILADAGGALGDAERTSAGFANQSKRVQGNLKTLAVNLGKLLLPAAAGFLQVLNDIIETIGGPLTLAFQAIGRVFMFAYAIIGGIAVGFQKLGIVGSAVLIAITAKVLILKGAITAAQLAIIKTKAIALFEFLLIAAIIVGVIAIIDDLWRAFTSGEGVLAGLAGEFMALAGETDSYLAATGQILRNAFDFWLGYFFGIEDASAKMGEAVVDAIRWANDATIGAMFWLYEKVKTGWGAMVDWLLEKIQPLVDFLADKLAPITETIVDAMTDLVGFASDIGLGDLAKTFGLTGPENIAAPGSPAARAAGGNVESQQNITVSVNAPGGNGPAIAAAVAPAVGRAAADGNRRTAQQLLVGGATP